MFDERTGSRYNADGGRVLTLVGVGARVVGNGSDPTSCLLPKMGKTVVQHVLPCLSLVNNGMK